MKISKFFQQSSILLASFGLLASATYINNSNPMPHPFISKQDSTTNFKNNFFQFFNLGQKRLITSLLWISTILESDIDHYKEKNLNSWMYLRFKTISILEPLFFENYAFGGPYLSVIKDDITGASDVFNLGINQYPDDLGLLQNAAFHFYFEAHDFKRAGEIHRHLIKMPKISPVIYSNLARMEHDSGNIEDAYKILENHYNSLNDKNSRIALKIRENLYSLKAEIDLNCLNNKKHNCQKFDLDHDKYLFDGSTFRAKKPWAKFEIKTVH